MRIIDFRKGIFEFSIRAKRYCNLCGRYVGDIPLLAWATFPWRYFWKYLFMEIRSIFKKYEEDISSINCKHCRGDR